VISSRGQRAFYFIGIMPVILMILLPYAMMLSGALKSPEEIVSRDFTLLPKHPQPGNFIEVFRVMPSARRS